MPRRAKDEQRTETIIRGLLKQPENRRCINCNSLGPQYVCTTFWTFVCTICSGVHREFTHRVKSVSMAKFTEEEITALQAGGNQRVREIYFKTWDPERNSLPDNRNLPRLREFVKHVYIDRRYARENNSTKVSMIKPDSRNNYVEQHSSRGGRDDFLERLSFERTSNGGRYNVGERSSLEKSSPSRGDKELDFRDIFEERSPQNMQENVRSGSNKNRPIRFEIVDDRYRDDGSVKHYERCANKEPRSGSSSPASHRGTPTNLPAIRPIKHFLGEKAPALKIGEPPKANDGKDAEGSATGQKRDDATIPGPPGAKPEQNKSVNPSSLIDFDATPEPTQNTAKPQAEPITSENSNESSSVAPSKTQMAVNAPNVNSLESLLLDWSEPVTSPSTGTSQMPVGANATQPNNSEAMDVGTRKAPDVSNSPEAPATTVIKNDQQLGVTNRDPMAQMNQVHPLLSMQQNQTSVSPPPRNASSDAPQSATSVDALSDQQLDKSSAPNDPRSVGSAPVEQSSQAVNSKEGTTSSGRKALPQDLFSSHINAFTPAFAGWHLHPPHGTGYGLQFQSPAMSVAAFANPSRPRNPFDLNDDKFQVQAAMFPSMSSLQGALPNMPISTALGYHPSVYATELSSQVSQYGYGMNMPQVAGAYMGQLPNNMQLSRPQEIGHVGRSEDAFASLNPIQPARGIESSPAAPNSSLSEGNPFG